MPGELGNAGSNPAGNGYCLHKDAREATPSLIERTAVQSITSKFS